MYRGILIAIIPKSTNKNPDWPLVVPFFSRRESFNSYTRGERRARSDACRSCMT